MDTGELYAALNALDVAFVKRKPNGAFDGLREGSETLPVVTSATNPATQKVELISGDTSLISSGTAAPVDADGKPDGTIYFQV